MAVDQADAVERLAGAGHRVDQADRDQPEIRPCRRLGAGRNRRRQIDRRGVGVGGGGDRQRAVGPHPQSEVEAVEFEPVNLDLQLQQRPNVEPDPAAGRREDWATGGIVNGDAAEAERHAAVAAHQRGRADRNDVTRTKPLLETAGDARIEDFEIDWPPGEQRRESADRRGDHQDGDKDGADCDAACAPPEQRLARTRQRPAPAAVQQMPNCGSRLGPRRCVDAADQTPQVSARLSPPFDGLGRRCGPFFAARGQRAISPARRDSSRPLSS